MVGSDSLHGVSRVVHHKDFYLRGGDLTVLVENHLYRIHSYFFERESLFFRQKFNSSNNDGEERGFSDRDHYTLEDVKSEDFARFLWVFYNPKYSVYEAPLETWLSILKLANRWTFDNVKELSVRELEKIEIEPVEKIAIYHDNNISRLYLIPSYISVCKRDKPLSFTEGMKLGMETVLRIAEARERLRLQASESGIRTPTFDDFEDSEVEILIREIFNLGARPNSPPPVTSPNGTANGTIKLGPAPVGNPPKANGASAPRANGGSATESKGSSVDSMRSIASVMSPQAPETAAPAPATAPPTTVRSPTATQEPQAPASSVPTVQTASASPPPPPPASDKPKDNKETAPQGQNNAPSSLSPKPGGVGEPSSSASYSDRSFLTPAHSNSPQENSSGRAFSDVSISDPVVPSSEHNNDLTTKSNDNVNEVEKDESSKDTDPAGIVSDTDGGKNKQTGKNNKKPGRGGQPSRGGAKK